MTKIVGRRIASERTEIYAQTLSRPVQGKSDGGAITYVVDVNIRGAMNVNAPDEILYNVPIAHAASELHHAERGSAVTLWRAPGTGRFELIGFSKRKPGRRRRVPVDTVDGTFGTTEDLGITTRPLTLGELADYGGGFGLCPLGAWAVFRGTTFLRLA